MSIHVNWVNAQHSILLLHYGPFWDWEDWEQADHDTLERLRETKGRVGLILDARSTQLPESFVSRLPFLFRNCPGLDRRQVQSIVVVSTSPRIEMVLGLFREVYGYSPEEIRLVHTLECAFTQLDAAGLLGVN